MSLAAAPINLVARYGAPYTLRRATRAAGPNAWTAGSETVAYHACSGRERAYRPSEIGGGIEAHDVLVTVPVSSLAVTPTPGDRIARGSHTDDGTGTWWQIVNVYGPRIGASAALYKLQVRA